VAPAKHAHPSWPFRFTVLVLPVGVMVVFIAGAPSWPDNGFSNPLSAGRCPKEERVGRPVLRGLPSRIHIPGRWVDAFAPEEVAE